MPWFFSRRSTPDVLTVRPATRADRASLSRLTERARRTHFHLDWWTLDDWIGDEASNAWLALADRRTAGVVIAPRQDAPVAWVRLISIADDVPARSVLQALMPPVAETLRAAGAASLACLAYPDWLAEQLPGCGFAPFTDVTHFRKDDAAIPDSRSAASIRPVRDVDLPAVLAVDRAAFDPIWWHTPDSLDRIRRDCAHFIVAELDGRIVGHAFSDVYGDRGHLIRLAVHPDFQKRGIGGHLLADALTGLLAAGGPPVTLNTQADNYTSQSLYRRFGFAPTGESTTVMLRVISGQQSSEQ